MVAVRLHIMRKVCHRCNVNELDGPKVWPKRCWEAAYLQYCAYANTCWLPVQGGSLSVWNDDGLYKYYCLELDGFTISCVAFFAGRIQPSKDSRPESLVKQTCVVAGCSSAFCNDTVVTKQTLAHATKPFALHNCKQEFA